MDYLKVINTEREIITALKLIRTESNPVIVWQNIGNRRIVAQARIQMIDEDLGIFVLKPLTKTDSFNFRSKITFYMKGQHRSLLFKQDKVKTNEKNIIIRVPESVRMYEKRGSARNHFGFMSPIFSAVGKPNEGELKQSLWKYPLYDISTDGVSLIVPHKDQGYFYPEDILNFSSIGDTQLDGNLQAEIVYIRNVTYRSNNKRHTCYKMGIRFKVPISQSFINELLKEAQYKTSLAKALTKAA